MNRAKTMIAVAALGALALAASNGQVQKDRTTQEFMRRKLVYADGVLQGLTLEKYDMVLTNAIRLRSMNMTNAFVRLGNAQYQEQIQKFQKSVEALAGSAQEANLEHATAAYMKVIESCVDCHKVFRREQFMQHTKPAEEK